MSKVLAREFYRRGASPRTQPVSFADVRKRFGFSSIRIGRWVTREERDRAAGLFYDALVDLMSILQGPEILISLRETLSFQYGIGGRPGMMAFYEPATRSFSLAKNAGPGSIAHEWFHALDHYLADKAFSDVGSTTRGSGRYASEAWLKGATPVPHPINDRLFACFRAIMLDQSGENPSELFRISCTADKANGCIYYSDPAEISARAFEAFVQDASISNNFLVSGTKASDEARMGLYPTGEHRQRINRAFSEYFRLLGQALKSQVQGN
ncbi:CLCA_X family protein [uncultured Microbulbifer sp.]|uniref:CLCA_X family protein n=1 Tax=uncultured Microbulbifer sp. TaxID=348147 RepID=UPI0025E1A163|nr:CLCA_X family protein [uncultured Microbulbifer sp.]